MVPERLVAGIVPEHRSGRLPASKVCKGKVSQTSKSQRLQALAVRPIMLSSRLIHQQAFSACKRARVLAPAVWSLVPGALCSAELG